MSKIAYLGDKYTHTYVAACKFRKDGDELIGYPTIYSSISAVAEGKCDFAACPIENSCGGSVADTLDALWSFHLYVQAETVLSVPQNLIGAANASIGDIRTVYSHAQAITQCAEFLRGHLPNAEIISVNSTAAALALITGKHIAAIARVPSEGQTVLAGDIEDNKNNSTRFVLLGRETCLDGNKCSIVFETRNTPGALVAPLEKLNEYGLNMTKIESRPHKSKLGRYVFFVDFDSSLDRTQLAKVIGELDSLTLSLKLLGQYPTI